jgi:hypothetical protein
VRTKSRLLAASALGAATLAAAIGTFVHIQPAGAADNPQGSLVETYDYPNGDKTPGIKLIKGDGHVVMVDCAEGQSSAEVWSFNNEKPYCFQFKGKTGYVTLELNDVYGIRNLSQLDITAKVSTVKDPIPVPKDSWKGVGVSGGTGPAVLLELRIPQQASAK